MKNSKLAGVLTSYVYIGVCVIYNLLLTPILIREFGQSEYGNYQYYYAIFASLNMFDFGFGTMATRYMALLSSDRNKDKWKQFIQAIFVLTVIVSVLIFCVGIFIYFISFWGADKQQYDFVLMILMMTLCSVLKFALLFYYGALNGLEKFAVSNWIQILQTSGKILLIVVLIYISQISFVNLSMIEFITLLIAFLGSSIFTRKSAGIRLVDWPVSQYCLKHSIFESKEFLLVSISNYINGKLIIVVIGNMLSKLFVTIYSVAYSVASYFESLSVMISSMYLPEATRLVNRNTEKKELEDFCIHPGRIQFMISTMILGGFIIVGKDFLLLWLGYLDNRIYATCLVMMLAGVFSIVMGIGIKLIVAEGNHLKIISRGRFISAIANLLLAITGIIAIGYNGVLISYFLTYFLMYGIYFPYNIHKIFEINYVRIFREISKRTLFCNVLSIILAYLLGRFFNELSFRSLLLKGGVYIMLYLFFTYIYGLDSREKELIKKIFGRENK